MLETETTTNSLAHVRPGEGDTVNVIGEGLRFLLSPNAMGTEVLLAEIISPPGGGPPAIHTHPPCETFYVLEGTIEFNQMGPDGPESFIAGPGSVVYVPGGATHNYKNVGETPSRMLGIFTSGAVEDFFRDMAAASTDEQGEPIIPPDVPKLMAVMAKHDVAFVGGPAGRG